MARAHWTCERCGKLNKVNPFLCESCSAQAPDADPKLATIALQRDLVTEGHLGAFGFWYRFGAILLVLVILLTYAGVGMFSGLRYSWRVVSLLAPTMSFTYSLAAGMFVLGHFLARFSNGARLTVAVLSILGAGACVLQLVRAPTGPTGTTIIAFVLLMAWTIAVVTTLLGRHAQYVCSPAYQETLAKTSVMRAQLTRSPFFIIPMALFSLVASMVVIVFAASR
jgi:hypothetical protein